MVRVHDKVLIKKLYKREKLYSRERQVELVHMKNCRNSCMVKTSTQYTHNEPAEPLAQNTGRDGMIRCAMRV